MQSVFSRTAGVLLILFCISLQGCEYNNFEELNPPIIDSCTVADTVSYSRDIRPLFISKCGTGDGNCHRDDNATGYGLSNYTEVINTFDDEGNDKVMKRLNHDPSIDPEQWMPKDAAKLSSCEIEKVSRWISQGRRDN